MTSNNHSAGDLMAQALLACARDRKFLREIEEGRVHEDQVVMALANMANETGSPVELVRLTASSHPLSFLRNSKKRPINYHYQSVTFLEVGERLLRIGLGYQGPGNTEKLILLDWPNRAAALQSLEHKNHHAWAAPAMAPDEEGKEALLAVRANQHLEQFLRSVVEMTQMQAVTPEAAKRGVTPRL
jgi:hypothetical protein